MAQHTVAIIGVGTVGQSWAALFLSYGNRVRLWDPVERLDERFAAYLENVVTEKPLPPPSKLSSLWVVCKTVEDALEGVTYVQENAPENMETKQAMLRRIDEVLPTDVIVGSSTSSFLLVDMVATCTRAPSRVVLSHPFNPPHLMPLVELFGTSDGSVAKAIAFYKSVGRHPITMNKQLPGHVANRLTSAIFREAVWMLREGIASVADIDAAMSQGPGMRFAHMGPFQTYHLAAGNGGIAQYLEHLGPSQEARWASLGYSPKLNAELKQQIVDGVDAMVEGKSIAELGSARDAILMDILGAKSRL